ncbi:Corticotropin-releasing factor receptor 1 [Saguinus oedipus]|uniref:Corticotropin-releasing factor receptor 1 n=1 Tax=Saguinus oedipus TaxID=9490 RepID=A0ABQ9VNJ1_SAGOE|nr:Corticotropin-releasing factor receptor 1 [Saguinus oedipus]
MGGEEKSQENGVSAAESPPGVPTGQKHGQMRKKSKVHYHVAVIINYLGHCISLVALLVAFVLFLRLRCLGPSATAKDAGGRARDGDRSIRCLRNIIHWNLISAFILRNATWFVVQLTMSPEVQQSNVVSGRATRSEEWDPRVCPVLPGGGPGPGLDAAPAPIIISAAYNYFHVTNFFWMFGEGCYLHTAVVLTYSTERLRKWVFICIGWGELRSHAGPQPQLGDCEGELKTRAVSGR